MNGVDGNELTSYLKEFMWFKVVKSEYSWLKSDSTLIILQRNRADPHSRILEAISQRYPTPWDQDRTQVTVLTLWHLNLMCLVREPMSRRNVWYFIQILNLCLLDLLEFIRYYSGLNLVYLLQSDRVNMLITDSELTQYWFKSDSKLNM